MVSLLLANCVGLRLFSGCPGLFNREGNRTRDTAERVLEEEEVEEKELSWEHKEGVGSYSMCKCTSPSLNVDNKNPPPQVQCGLGPELIQGENC